MHFYRVLHFYGDFAPAQQWADTKSSAHAMAKAHGKREWPSIRVDLVNVPTDRAGVLSILQASPSLSSLQAVKSWGLTDRGGLREEEPGKDG